MNLERDKRIREYINLPANWDSYGAEPFNSETIRLALFMSAILGEDWKAVPRADGPSVFFYLVDEEQTISVAATSKQNNAVDSGKASP